MIAMALACSPRLLIADEPTTALDVMVQAQVLDLLGALVRDLGLGLMLISHDLSVLATTCERVAVMYAGRVVEEGADSEVFTDPRHPYAAALAAAFPTIGDAALAAAPARPGRRPAGPHATCRRGCTFHPRCPIAVPAAPRLDPALRPAGPAGPPRACGSRRRAAPGAGGGRRDSARAPASRRPRWPTP